MKAVVKRGTTTTDDELRQFEEHAQSHRKTTGPIQDPRRTIKIKKLEEINLMSISDLQTYANELGYLIGFLEGEKDACVHTLLHWLPRLLGRIKSKSQQQQTALKELVGALSALDPYENLPSQARPLNVESDLNKLTQQVINFFYRADHTLKMNRRNAGKVSGKVRKRDHRDIVRKAKRMRTAGYDRRQIISSLARQFSKSKKQIRQILRPS